MRRYLLVALIIGAVAGIAYAEKINHSVVISKTEYCTAAQRALAADFLTNQILPQVNSLIGTSATISDLRPLQTITWTYRVHTLTDSAGIPLAGVPGEQQCLLTREISARVDRTPAAKGE